MGPAHWPLPLPPGCRQRHWIPHPSWYQRTASFSSNCKGPDGVLGKIVGNIHLTVGQERGQVKFSEARRKIMCKRFSTKSRLVQRKRSSQVAGSLDHSIPPHPGRYARRERRECRPGHGGTLRKGISRRSVRRRGSPAG